MSFYVKKLYDNELGYRKGIPNKAGKFLLVSKKRADFFPPHKTDEVDPSMSLGIIIDEMKHLVHAEYTHDNDISVMATIVENHWHGKRSLMALVQDICIS